MKVQDFETEPVWIPTGEFGSRMKIFMQRIKDKYRIKLNDYWDLHKWSVENLAEFWGEFWDFIGIIYSKGYDQVIDLNIPMEESPKWFEGAKVNFAENVLKHRDHRIAIIVAGEDRDVERITYRQVYEEARLYAAAFRNLGLQKGDRVACYMSNRKEAVIAMIAVTSIGAIWTGGLPLLGAQAYLNRLKQVEPRFLITIDEFPHNKEKKHLLPNIAEIAKGLSSLEKVIIVPSKPESKLKDISAIKQSCFLDEFLELGKNPDGSVPDIVFEQVSFSHPVFINYTSGTTGLPKTIVHGFGSLLPGVRDFWLHWDSQEGETWLSMSPVGWVSWNMVNNVLFAGETICLFEGVPYFLSKTYLWDMVDELKLTGLFMTAAVLDGLESGGYLPTKKHHLKSLNMILTAGTVVKSHTYDFVLKALKPGLIFAVGYATTETMGLCIILEKTLPMYRGEIQAPSLGVHVECLDDAGKSIAGEMGEFSISKPMPSLPLKLWGDNDGQVYKQSYFSKYPGKFTIGDAAIINPHTKGMIICGRSDETLKPGGWRFGSSEIYNIVEIFPEVQSSLCVAQFNKKMDERAVLFIKMENGCTFSQELVERIRTAIEKELTIHHVPEVILETPDIPHNANGKKMEIIVKKIINNMPHNAETVTNSECLKYYYKIPELQDF